MLEALLISPRVATSKYLVDINFEKEAVGSKAITDQGTLGVGFTRTALGGASVDGVINDPTFGKCYKFDGSSIFAGNKRPGVWNKSYRMELKFVNIGGNISALISAGDYPGTGPIRAGWAFSINQYPANYFQMFMVQSSPTFDRILPSGSNPGPTVLETVIITRIGGVITVTLQRNGQSAGSAFNTGDDYLLYLGGSYAFAQASAFQGLLKSFTIELLD